MEFQPVLIRHLDSLSQALDGTGDDLQAILSVLIDDLAAAVPSFLGLTVTVQLDDQPVRLTAVQPAGAGASMLLPLNEISGLPEGSQLVFYAADPGAFVNLAADARAAYDLAGQVVVDGHLPPPTADPSSGGTNGLTERSTLNQAMGVLMEQGYLPVEARDELRGRARATGVPDHEAAEQLLLRL